MTVIFTHIPKCGGTTLRDILKRVYSRAELLYPPEVDQKIANISNAKPQDFSKIELIAGHVGFGIHRKISTSVTLNPRFITMLRNPVERVISYYTHCKNNKDTNISEYVKDMSLEEFIDGEFSNPVENFQTRFLSGIPNLKSCDEHTLKTSISNIDNHYVCCGILERFEESLLVFQDKLNWPDIPLYRTLNKAKQQINVSSDTYKKIQAKNELDIILYNHADNKFNQMLENMKDFSLKRQLFLARLNGYDQGYMAGSRESSLKAVKRLSYNDLLRISLNKIANKIRR